MIKIKIEKFSPSGLLWGAVLTSVTALKFLYDFPIEYSHHAFFYVTTQELSVMLAAYRVGDGAYEKLSRKPFGDKLFGLGKVASLALIFAGVYFFACLFIRSIVDCVLNIDGGSLVGHMLLVPAAAVMLWLLTKLNKLTKSPDITPLVVTYFIIPPFMGMLAYIMYIPYYLLGTLVAYVLVSYSRKIVPTFNFN